MGEDGGGFPISHIASGGRAVRRASKKGVCVSGTYIFVWTILSIDPTE